MKYQVEDYPSFSVAGFATKMMTNQAFELVPKLWEQAFRDGTIDKVMDFFHKTDYRPAGLIGTGIQQKDQEVIYVIGTTNSVRTEGCQYVEPLDGMNEFQFPAAKWVIVNADGMLPDAVQNVYREFYDLWLPTSDYEYAGLPEVECYYKNQRQEIWFAVKPVTTIRQLHSSEQKAAMDLVWNVFQQFEAPEYPEEGIKNFHTFITDENNLQKMNMIGAFREDRLVGVLATKQRDSHISLLFVDAKYHRQGIGKRLIEYLCQKRRPIYLTVNASPYAEKIYEHLGFVAQDSEQLTDGIRYIPMRKNFK